MNRAKKRTLLALFLVLLPFALSSCELIMDEFWSLDQIQPKIDLPTLEQSLR